MEKSRVTAAALLLLGALAFGQQSEDQEGRRPSPGRSLADMNMEQFAEMNAMRAQQMLGMSESQIEKTAPILAELFLLQMEITTRQVLSGEDAGNELTVEDVAEREERDTELIEELAEILSEEQMETYLEMREMQNRLGGGFGGRGGRQQNRDSGAQSL